MRALLLAVSLSLVATVAARADDTAGKAAKTTSQTAAGGQHTYHGFLYDASAIADRQDRDTVEHSLQHQLDVVESVKLSPRVLDYFRTIPIVVDELACFPIDQPGSARTPVAAAACYGNVYPVRTGSQLREPSVWDSKQGKWTNVNAIDLAEDTVGGIVMVRPLRLDPKRPVVLHEYLHAFHAHMLPRGYNDQAIAHFYNAAKKKDLFPEGSYFLANEQEFFAVTASILLSGSETIEPFSRDKIKEKLPDYYRYLTWLFELDPDQSTTPSPVAMAN